MEKKMNQKANRLLGALELVRKDFNLDIPTPEKFNSEEFKKVLTLVIRHLLYHDFERLINGLYRIDVSEEKVKLAMENTQNLAVEIASLIIERELQKVITRERYRDS